MAATAWTARAGAYAASAVHRAGPSLPRLLALLRPQAGDRACDLGCGAGATTVALARAGCAEVVAVDADAGMLGAAADELAGEGNVRFLQADAAATGLPPASFDLISARHTLHHHADPAATLREVARLLRPGGRFAFVDEVALSPELDPWYQELERTRDPSHGRCLTVDGWAEALEAAGLAWVAGDARTHYRIEIDAWLTRVGADAAQDGAVRRALRDAPVGAAERLRFDIDADGAVTAFQMPMAIVLAVKPAAPSDPTPEGGSA